MIEQLAKFQISKNEITTYLIGGSSSFNITIGKSKNVAERNVETAQAMLKKNNIRYTEYVNGTMSRKVQFNTKNGELLINED
jgi:chemotaxis receptor (MCP) glutamine deamidase CheD